jgi:hypothetical protein
MAAFKKSIATLEKSLETSRASLSVLVAAYDREKAPTPPSLGKLLAWEHGQVAGNVTPDLGADKKELQLQALEDAADPSHCSLLLLAMRAEKLVAGMQRAEGAASGRMERPAGGSLGPAHLPALVFTAEQSEAASKNLDTAFPSEIKKIQEEAAEASTASSVPASQVGDLLHHMEVLRQRTAQRAGRGRGGVETDRKPTGVGAQEKANANASMPMGLPVPLAVAEVAAASPSSVPMALPVDGQ